jgi:hypothetical protein
MPTVDLIYRVELAGVPGAPQSNRRTLIKHPANRKRQNRLAEARASFLSSSTAARYWRALELRIDFAEIVAVEFGIRGHPPAKKATAESAVA